jgi:hypothetical protein
MSGAWLEAVAHIALAVALVCGIAVGWATADVIESFRRKL